MYYREVVKGFNTSQVQFTLNGELLTKGVLIAFQSLTGSIHTDIVNFANVGNEEFQSLTGSIHTLDGLALDGCFNPSQVQFTLMDGLMDGRFNPSQVQFTQSLIG